MISTIKVSILIHFNKLTLINCVLLLQFRPQVCVRGGGGGAWHIGRAQGVSKGSPVQFLFVLFGLHGNKRASLSSP